MIQAYRIIFVRTKSITKVRTSLPNHWALSEPTLGVPAEVIVQLNPKGSDFIYRAVKSALVVSISFELPETTVSVF